MTTREFPALLQAFFTERLQQQRQASPHTLAAYRHTFCLLLRFAATRLHRPPSRLVLADLDAAFLGQFLEHLQHVRGNAPRTRNARLAALHAFFRYVALNEPAHALHCQRVLAIPGQRFERAIVEFLHDEEVAALLQAPDPATWIGRRDHALLLVAVQTGLRVSELIGLRRQDVTLATAPHLRCHGKGRKLRCTPLRRDVVRVLEAWLDERPMAPDAPVFATARGGPLSDDAVEHLVTKHTAAAKQHCPSLAGRRVTPHVLRHTAAMEMLRRGVDRSVIALWLGHESIETTQIYLHADLDLVERALAHITPSGLPPGRYHPDDALLQFLESL